MQSTFDPVYISNTTPSYKIDIFSHAHGIKQIAVESDTDSVYLAIVSGTSNIHLEITTVGPRSAFRAHVLCLGKANHETSCTVSSHLGHDETTTNMHIVTFLPTKSTCTVNGNVTIAPKTKKVSGHLLEENIILGENVTIQTLPMLDVHANDVRASHGARIERIDAKKLFYAQSRGLRADQATGLIIGGYFDLLFSHILNRIPDMAEKAHVAAIKHNYQRMLLGEM